MRTESATEQTTLDRPANHGTELELLLICARWPRKASDRELIRRLTARSLDWPRFLLLVEHHRLVPLVFANLKASISSSDIPVDDGAALILEQLSHLASANTYRALRSLAEMRRLTQAFLAHGIKLRILKGLAVAQTAFGDISLRAAGDIDLLIEEASLLDADRALRQAGYSGLFHLEQLTPKRLSFYRAHWKDNSYQNPTSNFEVDLHWRCFRNPRMPGTSLCTTPVQQVVSFGSFTVATLPPIETLLYLCVHGTLDGWLYLKSLADIAAQVRQMSEPDLNAAATAARNYGIPPELSAALLLVRRYFEMDHWSELLLTDADATVSHILRFAARSLIGGNFQADRNHISPSKMLAFEFGLRRNFRYRRELLVRVLFRARMWQTVPLPDFLFGLYPLLSPLEWILFRIQRLRVSRSRPATSEDASAHERNSRRTV